MSRLAADFVGEVETLAKALVATIGLSFSLVAYEHLLFFTTTFVILLAG